MRGTVQLLAGIAILGCSGAQSPTESAASFRSPAANASLGADVNKDLATLRQATAPFQQFENATAAGWSAQITPCMTDANGAGGMGFHYGNTDLINGTVSVDKPEILLYEPERNGRLRLVAVEYIIPYTFHSRESEPPVLFGQQFKQNDTFKLWGLHAWVWKENPSGMFASWNPKVTCENAASAAPMTH